MMRVALLSYNAQIHNAVGNHIAEKVRFFQERGAQVRVFVQDVRRLHPELCDCTSEVRQPHTDGPVWDELQKADLIFVVYAKYYDLLQYLPLLVGTGPRIVFDYLGVTPREFWPDQQREELDVSNRQRGYAWCTDHVLTISAANRRELLEATKFPREHVTTLPLAVDTARFRPELRDRHLHAKLGITGPILLFVGRIAGNKRVPLLIEALAHRHDAHAAIVGDCSDVYTAEAARCRALAEHLGVVERVHWLGQLDDAELARAYRSADVLVMPSLHEGFCVPVIEAMASGLPVLASRSAALPETVGDGGLTFAPDDFNDLVRQLNRVLDTHRAALYRKLNQAPRRIAVVSFRFGLEIVGGAEASLRSMAEALRDAGNHVEVFTTCTVAEARWKNEVPARTVTLAGVTVHRFPIDPHDPIAHGETVRAILEADGHVTRELERRYLEHSIHSSALIDALRAQRDDFDAVIVGPYLFGLTADVASEFTDKTLLAPCFHDEPMSRLELWPRIYGEVGGILYHSAAEQAYSQAQLGVNHPNARVIGACVQIADAQAPGIPGLKRPYVVYCGRRSAQKNVPLLLEWARRYQAERTDRLDLVFVGQGEVTLPAEPWLHDLGRIDEATKHSVLAGAAALVQLSTQESLSLVVLEAWAQKTPVIVHRDCAVLAGQIERSGGGASASSYEEFAALLDDLCNNGAAWRRRGADGRRYVDAHYSSREQYVGALTSAIGQMQEPIGAQMRARGPAWAAEFARSRWQQRFADFVERLLTQAPRACRHELIVEPLRNECRAAVGSRTLLVPVRIRNAGTHAATAEGPGRSVICCEIRATTDGGVVGQRTESALPGLLMPGHVLVVAVPVAIPSTAGAFRIALRMESPAAMGAAVELPLIVVAEMDRPAGGCAASFLDTVQEALPRTHQLTELPANYVDVTEGQLAPVKRLIKKKLLNNFKHAYVDVLSRQQSQVNGQVVLMIQQLAECCALLDHAITGLHHRLDGLEAKIEQITTPPENETALPPPPPQYSGERGRG
jgi:O-antigen biosynthesis protein